MKPSYISHSDEYIKTPAYSTLQGPYDKSSIYSPINFKSSILTSGLGHKKILPSVISMIGHDRLLDSLSNFAYK